MRGHELSRAREQVECHRCRTTLQLREAAEGGSFAHLDARIPLFRCILDALDAARILRLLHDLLEEEGVERVPHKRVARVKGTVDVDSLWGDDALEVDWPRDWHVLPRRLAHVTLKNMPPVGQALAIRHLASVEVG